MDTPPAAPPNQVTPPTPKFFVFYEPGGLSRGIVRRRTRGAEVQISPLSLVGVVENSDGTSTVLTLDGAVAVSNSYDETLRVLEIGNVSVGRNPVLVSFTLYMRGLGARRRGSDRYEEGGRICVRSTYVYAIDRDENGFAVAVLPTGSIPLVASYDALAKVLVDLQALRHPDDVPFRVQRSTISRIVNVTGADGNLVSAVILRGGASLFTAGTPQDIVVELDKKVGEDRDAPK